MAEPLLKHPFDPLFDAESRVLILGSFPSVVSREKDFYYANATNRFWPLMAMLFEEEILDRREFCHRRHIALWDVIFSCRIHASSDASITDVTAIDIDGLVRKTKIRAVCTTGRKAGSLYEKYVDCDRIHICLPSTSAANARMRMEDRLKEYRKIKEYAEKD